MAEGLNGRRVLGEIEETSLDEVRVLLHIVQAKKKNSLSPISTPPSQRPRPPQPNVPVLPNPDSTGEGTRRRAQPP